MQSTKLNYVIIYRPFIKDITSNGFFFFNEEFQIEYLGSWTFLLSHRGAGCDRMIPAGVLTWCQEEWQDRWFLPVFMIWKMRRMMWGTAPASWPTPQSKCVPTAWGSPAELMGAIAAHILPTEEGGGCLGMPSPALPEEDLQKSFQCKHHRTPLTTALCSCSRGLTKRVLRAGCFPAGGHQWLLLSSTPK